MKSKSFLLFIMAIVTMISCVKQELVSEADITNPIPPNVVSPLNFTVLGTMTATIPGDTLIYVQKDTPTTLEASTTGSAITNWSWSFSDDNSTASGKLISHTFSNSSLIAFTSAPVKCLIKLIGTDSAGKKYERTRALFIVWYVGDYWGIQNISTEINADKSFSLILACHKNGMNYKGSQYAYTGSITNPPWTGSILIAPADTSYNIVNGKAVAAINGVVGKYVLVRLNFNLKLGTTSCNMGVGKISGNNLNWGAFWGPFVGSDNYTMIKFDIALDAQGGVLVAPRGVN